MTKTTESSPTQLDAAAKPAEQAVINPAEQAAAKPEEQAAEQAVVKPAEQPAAQPHGQGVAKSAEPAVAKPDEEIPKPNSTWEDWKKSFNIFIGILTVIGTGVAIVAWYEAHKVERIAYVQTVAKIFDASSHVKSIQIYDSKKEALATNVFVYSITMWNYGNVNIDKAMIKRGIRLYVDGKGRILDPEPGERAKMRAIHQDVADFSLTAAQDMRSLSLSWEFFGTDAGFTANIIYTGDETTMIKIDPGYIVDLKGNIVDFSQISTTWKRVLYGVAALLGLVLLTIAGFAIWFTFYVVRFFLAGMDKWIPRFVLGGILAVLVVLISLFVALYNVESTSYLPGTASTLLATGKSL